MSAAISFEPGRHLSKVGGSDYLEVKWRLVWLRETHPNAAIETELVSHDGSFALFRARVSVPGGGSATGWGSEGIDDFRDYIEKAETKAIGRALAALGFGTQFCPDFDFGAGAGRVVDAPIDFASTRGRRLAAGASPEADQQIASVNQPATQRQLKFIQAIAREAGLDDVALNDEAREVAGAAFADLSRRAASALIERLQARRGGAEMAS
ncbi:MAG: hypothetical protein M3Q10_12925 [Chloroflexota bacterium]|nr:hypothetical protein [Chloroflexota bacterium]